MRLISPEQLRDDNASQIAGDRLKVWSEARDSGKLMLVIGCGDSRTVYPWENTIIVTSIAAGGRRSPYERLIRNPRIMAGVIVSHHDGETVKTCYAEQCVCKSPGGCGGRLAKGQRDGNGKNITDLGILNFVDKHLWSDDLFKQTAVASGFSAARSGRLFLGGSLDHRSLQFFPLLLSDDEGQGLRAEVPTHAIMQPDNFPHELYGDGLRPLREDRIPEVFKDYISRCNSMAFEMNQRYPDLRSSQEVQNPSLLVLSTDTSPLRVRFPETLERPGNVFSLRIADQTLEGTEVISPQVLVDTLNQAEYPVAHFSNLATIYIETKSMAKSFNAAMELAQQSWMRTFMSDPDKRILIGQVFRGRLLDVKTFDSSRSG